MRSPWSLPLLFVSSLLAGCFGTSSQDPIIQDTVFTEPQIEGVTWELVEDFESVVRVTWEQLEPADVWIEFVVDEGEVRSSPLRTVEAGPVEELLLGVPFETDIEFIVVNDFGSLPLTTDPLTATTGAPPDGMNAPTLGWSDAELQDPTMQYVVTGASDVRGWTIIFDRLGRVVWARQTPGINATLHTRVSYDGTDLLIDHNTYWATFDDGAGSQVVRMKIDGTEVAVYDTPGLHHPFTELADGTLVWGAADGLSETVEKLTPEGEQVRIWDCADFYELEGGDHNYCQSNTLFHVEDTDTFLFSLYSDETIVEIDHETGMSLRWFGHDEGSWGFDPPESAFHWQHGGHITAEGTLLTSSHVDGTSDECVVREYELDEEEQVLREVWSFGVGLEREAEVMGEAHRLPGGNTLHNYGSGARVLEVTPDGEVVWEVSWHVETMGGYRLGRTTPVEDLYAFAP
jgi:hypothetical protein